MSFIFMMLHTFCQNRLRSAFLLLSSATLLACAPLDYRDPSEMNEVPIVFEFTELKNDPRLSIREAQIDVSPAFNSLQQADIKKTYEALLSPFNGSPQASPFFAEAFGGETYRDVGAYLAQRIRVLVPSQELARENDTLAEQEESNPVYASVHQESDEGLRVIATNIGTYFWLNGIANSLGLQSYYVGKQEYRIRSSRVGIVELTKHFFNTSFPIGRRYTLIHEAKHSDCPGGISRHELINSQKDGQFQGLECGHLHSVCQSGPYVGKLACDNHAWGAYAMELLYAQAVRTQCKDCDELSVQIGLMKRFDSFKRIHNAEDMLAGKFGPPNMSSSSEVRP
jgi:hypothetical protein